MPQSAANQSQVTAHRKKAPDIAYIETKRTQQREISRYERHEYCTSRMNTSYPICELNSTFWILASSDSNFRHILFRSMCSDLLSFDVKIGFSSSDSWSLHSRYILHLYITRMATYWCPSHLVSLRGLSWSSFWSITVQNLVWIS